LNWWRIAFNLMWPTRSWVSMLHCGRLSHLYSLEIVLDESAESNAAMQWYLGEVTHSSCQRATNALVPDAMVAAPLIGSGDSKSLIREERGDELACAASFAHASTASLPAMLTRAGTQWIRTLRVRRARQRRARRAWKAARRYCPGCVLGEEGCDGWLAVHEHVHAGEAGRARDNVKS
jgi:hypothetical protein